MVDAYACGASICAADGRRAYAIEPGTGEVRWTVPEGVLWAAGSRRMYVARDSPDGVIGVGVVDTATGRSLVPLDETWQPVRQTAGPRLPVLVAARVGQTLAVLDADRLALQPLAALDATQGPCLASDVYVACAVAADRWRVWRYTPDRPG